MSKLIIQGGNKLSGEIEAKPGKNYMLPVFAASLLTDQPCIVRNVPKIRDVAHMLKILQYVGTEVTYLSEDCIQLVTPKIIQSDLPESLVQKLRASVLLLGSLLGRNGTVSMYHPGGDKIGRRSIETHLLAFAQLGVEVSKTSETYFLKAKKLGGTVTFDEISVTATENALLLAATIPEITTIYHAALEPHVAELCKVLMKMGVHISGIGTSTLTVTGTKVPAGFEHTFGVDHIEVGTWAVLAGVTHGKLKIKNVNPADLRMINTILSRFGIVCQYEDQKDQPKYRFDYVPKILSVTGNTLQAVTKVDALPWPGFPTDLISMIIVLATQAQGVTLVRDVLYEGRMFFVDKLITMGANIVICDPHRVLIYGKSKLTGKHLESPDIRAGMALVLAALVAKGESVISNIELIERDYEDLESRLKALGATIERVEE